MNLEERDIAALNSRRISPELAVLRLALQLPAGCRRGSQASGVGVAQSVMAHLSYGFRAAFSTGTASCATGS